MTPLVSSATFGKFVCTKPLGSGGMGEVWKAWDSVLGRWVALKFLKSGSAEELARFQREARVAAGLSHPNIGAIYEVDHLQGQHFIAMQYVEGLTLDNFVGNDRRLAVTLVRDAAEAVQYAHRQGIVHRDIKPENIMVSMRPGTNGPHVYVMDFGLARSTDLHSTVSKSGQILGTPAFMSPEQARGAHVDERTDIYSLGATLYLLLTGRRLFDRPNVIETLLYIQGHEPEPLRSIDSAIDRDIETIVLKCLEKDPAHRYPTAAALAQDLSRYLAGEPIAARPSSIAYRLRKRLLQRKAITAAIIGMVAAAVVAACLVVNDRREDAALEKARPHLEAGRRGVEQMRLRMRSRDHTPIQLEQLGLKARREFVEALAQDPAYPEALLGLATTFSLTGEKARALSTLDQAIRLAPLYTPAYIDRVRLVVEDLESFRHGRPDEPLTTEARTLKSRLDQDLATIKRLAREEIERRYADGVLAFGEGMYDEASRILEQYLEVYPEDGPAHYWRGHALYHLGRFEDSIAALTRALECDARSTMALLNRGNSRDAKGDWRGAIEDYTRSLEIEPAFAMASFNRGNTLRDHGDVEAALRDYTRAIEIDPGFGEAYVNRGRLYASRNEPGEALADYEQAIRVKPGLFQGYYNRALSRESAGRVEDAIEDYTSTLTINPSFAEAHSNRGRLRGLKGDAKGAMDDFEAAIRLKPELIPPRLNRAKAREAQGDFRGAIADYERILEIAPAAWNYRDEVEGMLRRARGN